MIKAILFPGLIAGLVVIGINILVIQLGLGQAWLGFLVMFVVLSSIYFAIRRYREQTLGGSIGFLRAFGLGLAMSLAAGFAYVVVWELYLVATNHAFINDYAQSLIETSKAGGASEAELAATIAQTTEMKINYANPLFRLPMTLLEILPVGVLISLISGLLLRKEPSAE